MQRGACHVVSEFLHAFMSGDTEAASSVVPEDFSFRAPLRIRPGNKSAGFAGAGNKARYIGGFRILRQLADGARVATLYEPDVRTPDATASLPISDRHTVQNGRMASSLMVFDTAAAAVDLLRKALRAHWRANRRKPSPPPRSRRPAGLGHERRPLTIGSFPIASALPWRAIASA
jgi:hypothetical protein